MLGTAVKIGIIEIAMISGNVTRNINVLWFIMSLIYHKPFGLLKTMLKISHLTVKPLLSKEQLAMLLLTNAIASINLLCGIDENDYFNCLMLLCYLGWIGLTIRFIHEFGKIMMSLNDQLFRSTTGVKMKSSKIGKKRRTRRPIWYRRRKNKLQMKRKYEIEQAIKQKAAKDEKDWWDYEHPPPSWKILHLIGNHLAEQFDKACKHAPLLVDMIGPNERSTFEFATNHSYRTSEWLCNVNDMVIDLTKITETNSTLRWQAGYHTEHAKQIIFDSGASISISPYKEDFIDLDTSEEGIRHLSVQAVNSKVKVKGVGTIRLVVYTDTGFRRHIETKAFWCPDAKITLLSVIRYCYETKDGACFKCDDKGVVFHFTKSSGGGKITFQPPKLGHYIPSTTHFTQNTHFDQLRKSIHDKLDKVRTRVYNVIDTSNINLTRSQKSLLMLHFCLGHWNMQWIQSLLRKGILKSSDPNITTANAICECAACNFAKAKRKNKGTVKQEIRKEKDGGLKKNILRVGAMVSSDQFICSTPGRLPQTYGKESENSKYIGGTIFIDEASGKVFLENQVSTNATETIKAKNKFEREASRFGIKILGYRADNGIYKSKEFLEALKQKGQTIQFSGIGAHHHNGIAERAIQTISSCARAMMIHAIIHNPKEVQADLWPFAMKYAVWLWNRMPKKDSGLSPDEVFYNVKSDHEELRQAKCWGCPAYVLDPKLQDGKSLPRWNPRSKLGQFLGRSDVHSSNVGLIRNLQTGKVSAQFHVVYDNHFTTVKSETNLDNIPIPDGFNNLMRFSRENHFDEDDLMNERQRRMKIAAPRIAPSEPPLSAPRQSQPETGGDNLPNVQVPAQVPEGANDQNNDGNVDFDNEMEIQEVDNPVEADVPTAEEPAPEPERRSRYPLRERKQPDRFVPTMLSMFYAATIEEWYDAFLLDTDLTRGSDSMTQMFDVYNLYKQDDFDEEMLESIHPFAFSARANSEDTPNYHQAMKSPDAEGFKEAMEAEWNQLTDMNAWEIVPREKAVKMNKRVIDSVWTFRRKRYPDGSVKKLKARLCVRGDLQIEGVDFSDTYSPVVSWSTVRLLLILTVILDLKTKQIDYTLAFIHAKSKPGVFIEMPRGYEREGHVLELKRNLYGSRDAPKNFYYHLKNQLELRGFKSSASDPGLFINEETGCLIVCYCDDCIFFHRDEKEVDKVIDSLKKPDKKDKRLEKFLLNVEEDYAGFLGIDIKKHKDGSIELVQLGLIDRILTALNLSDDDVTTRLEPAGKEPLGKDEDGPSRKESWSYPSLVGMLLYLSGNSRPDIAFAVNQAARFNHCPRLIHETAIKRIARYLKGTRDRGLIINPQEQNMILELYSDADFAGLWNVEESDDPICVRSRTGYVITLGGVPLIWSSKLQTEIATSTMHAEYIALSTSMRELIPVQNVLNDICNALKIERDQATQIATIHEDNEGALNLANSPLPKITPHSKHFAVKYHWFREKLTELKVVIKYVKTTYQKADIFTKGLTRNEFKTKRNLLMGW